QTSSLPDEGPVLRYNPAVFDQQAAPGDHPPVLAVIVTDHLSGGSVTTARVRIGNFLGLYVRVQLFLSIFQAHGDVRIPFRSPKKGEIIAVTLAKIQPGNGAVEMVLP